MAVYKQSKKLHNVLYDIRGPLLEEAERMESRGNRILKLNIGNPAPFGFEAPDAIMMDFIRHLPELRATQTRAVFTPHALPSSSTTKHKASSPWSLTTFTWATVSLSLFP